MKTTTAFENMTDEELSKLINDKLQLGTNAFGRIGVATYNYATSLDVCREAIEKFHEITSGFQFSMLYAREVGWSVYIEYMDEENHTTMFNVTHQNPARAACVCILLALEKN